MANARDSGAELKAAPNIAGLADVCHVTGSGRSKLYELIAATSDSCSTGCPYRLDNVLTMFL